MKIGSIIIFHLSKLRKAKFFTLCDAVFLVRLQGKFGYDHSWEWKGEERNGAMKPHIPPRLNCSVNMGALIRRHSSEVRALDWYREGQGFDFRFFFQRFWQLLSYFKHCDSHDCTIIHAALLALATDIRLHLIEVSSLSRRILWRDALALSCELKCHQEVWKKNRYIRCQHYGC